MARKLLDRRIPIGALVLLMGLLGARAGAVPLVNPGFEAVILDEGQYIAGVCQPEYGPDCIVSADPIPGWQTGGPAGTFRPSETAFPGGPSEGVNAAFLPGQPFDEISTIITLSQDLPIGTPGGAYVLHVDVGNPADRPIATWEIAVLRNNAFIASVLGSPGSSQPDEGAFRTYSLPFTLVAGVRHTILITSYLGWGPGEQVAFDDVRVELVPESSTVLLVGVGLLLLARVRKGAARL